MNRAKPYLTATYKEELEKEDNKVKDTIEYLEKAWKSQFEKSVVRDLDVYTLSNESVFCRIGGDAKFFETRIVIISSPSNKVIYSGLLHSSPSYYAKLVSSFLSKKKFVAACVDAEGGLLRECDWESKEII